MIVSSLFYGGFPVSAWRAVVEISEGSVETAD